MLRIYNWCVELLRLSKAAKRLGIQTMTLRQWAIDDKIPFTWVGRERRFSSVDVESMELIHKGAVGAACWDGREFTACELAGTS